VNSAWKANNAIAILSPNPEEEQPLNIKERSRKMATALPNVGMERSKVELSSPFRS